MGKIRPFVYDDYNANLPSDDIVEGAYDAWSIWKLVNKKIRGMRFVDFYDKWIKGEIY